MINEKIFLRSKSVSEDLNWIIFVEALQNFPRIDLTYQYRLEFKKGGLYFKDGFSKLLVVNNLEKTKWINVLQVFIERCIKLRQINSEIEIDFPIVNRVKYGKDYSYFFRYKDKRLFLDIRRDWAFHNQNEYNYRVSKKMKILTSVEIPMDKIIKMLKDKINLKRILIQRDEELNKTIKKIDKQKIKW